MKCWKKTKNQNRYWRDNPYHEIDILSNNGKYAVFIDNTATKNRVSSKKSQALKFANKYMRENNKC